MRVDEDPGRTFEAVTSRRRLLVVSGGASTLVGLAVAAFVGYEWFVQGVSHEVLTMIAGVALLFGVQVLVLASLAGMLITLHRETLQQVEEEGETATG